MLPLLETLTANLARKYSNFHKIILTTIIVSNLLISIFLPISQQVYVIDFGFIQLKFMCDIYGYFFGILINLVWLLTTFYSYSYNKINLNRNRVGNFFKYLALSIFAVLGNCYAADLWTLFIFYVLMIFFTSPLILQNKNKAAFFAEKLYLLTHLSTSFLFFLPAILLIKHHSGSVDFINNKHEFLLNNHHLGSALLFLFVMGIAKNCTIPFHNWITRATVAPVPVSSLLHSVAAVKSGSIAMIKIVVYVFGLDYVRQLTDDFWTGGWIFYLCGASAVYAAYRALKTTNIKKRFAYSTISQLSYILSSVMIATKLALMGAVLHIVSHSLCKIILFYIAGIFGAIYKTNSTKDIAKLAPNLKPLIFCIAFCGASIIGIPFFPGSFGKDYMLLSELQTHHYSAIIFLVSGSLINILYIYPVVKAGFFHKKDDQFIAKKIPFTMKLSIMIAMIIAVLLSVFISNITNFFMSYDV
jgi:multicomponent Na+:H+ antiporter subunit D